MKRKNQIFNIIYLVPKNKKIKYKIKKKIKNHSQNNSFKAQNIININININQEDEKMENENKSIDGKIQYGNDLLQKSLEDIIEEDDEGKSATSSSRDIKYEKMMNEKTDKSPKLSIKEESDEDDDDFDSVYDEFLKLKSKRKKD